MSIDLTQIVKFDSMLSFYSKYRRSWQLQIQTLTLNHNFQIIFPYSTSTKVTQSFSNYLVNSLGFSHQKAALTCSKLPIDKVNDFKFYDNAISVVNFLKTRGFKDTHVRKIVSLCPIMLCCKVDKTLEPKYELLRDSGFSESDLVRVISATPTLLFRHMNNIIVNLRDVLGSVENVKKLFRNSNIFTTTGTLENMISNIALLSNDYGIDINVIRNSILQQHTPFMRNPEFFQNVVVRVEEELGIPRDSKMFFHGIRLYCASSKKNIESKCRVYKSFGWTEDQVSNMMTRNPNAFLLSEANIMKKLSFLMNELGYNPDFLASRTPLLYCSFEKRMFPRYRVLQVLKEKGLVKINLCKAIGVFKEKGLVKINFSTAIGESETNFVKKYIERFKEDVPGILEIYQNSKSC